MPPETEQVASPSAAEKPGFVPPDPDDASEFSSRPVATERDDLKAVADAALAEAGVETEGDPKPAPAAKPKAAVVDDPEAPKGISKLAASIRARVQSQKLREQAQAERTQMLAEVQRELAQAKTAREQAEGDRAKLQRLRDSPLDAIKELGWDTTDLVHNVAREGSPEWQMLRVERAERAKLEAKLADVDKWRLSLEDTQKRAYEQHAKTERARVVGEFLGSVPEESALRTLYDDDEIVAKADAVHNAYHKETGQIAPLAEIREYLEVEAKKRLDRLRGQASGPTGKTAPKVAKAGNGQRTLASSTSSERRAAPKSWEELGSADDQRKALIEAAEEARRTAT